MPWPKIWHAEMLISGCLAVTGNSRKIAKNKATKR
jgi:hypothetical protein